MTQRIAILQSSYIPWKGYFDIINSVDEFVIYDSVQYTRQDWRNRNRVKTRDGTRWLTIPVATKGLGRQRIDQVRIGDGGWAQEHWKTLSHAYARAPFFDHYAEELAELYRRAAALAGLSEVNLLFLTAICRWLAIATPLRPDTHYALEGDRSQRLLGICRQAGAGVYLSGPSARDYLDVALFEAAGIEVQWADYGGYAEYRQLHGPFEHQVSALDLLFSVGPQSRQYLKSCSPAGLAAGG